MPIIWENVGVTTRVDLTEEEEQRIAWHQTRTKQIGKAKAVRTKKASELKATIDQVRDALTEWNGSITHAAKSLKVDATILRRKVQVTPSLQYHLKNIMEMKKDIAEYELFQQVQDGVLPAIVMLLKTQAKDRGYSERDQEGDTNIAIVDSASLIEAMRKGQTKVIESTPRLLEVKDAQWEEE